ncbi:Uncharacterised protein [Mycobacteroides abscessus subsp. abscessus]|nr:Uncharacterised protein [Mycobacteroides abscessus subsp. abscessus]
MSSSTAWSSSVNGMASRAPSAPRTQVQKISDRKVTVTLRPTASPTYFGWITDWMTKLITL